MSNADLENMLYGLVSIFGIGTTILFPVLILLLFVVLIIVLFLLSTIVVGIPLYKMAKNAGFKHPFFAFIPFLQTYLMIFLPQEDYKLFNLVNIKDRHKAAWIMTLVANAPTILLILYPVIYCIPILGMVLISLLSAASSLLSIAVYIIMWKCYYDLYRLYHLGENDVLFSILSLFVPFLGIILLFVLMNKEPDYGFGNIYNVANENEVYS